MKKMIIEPFSYVFCSCYKVEEECDGNGGIWESVYCVEPGIIKITRLSYSPEEIKDPNCRKSKRISFLME